MNVQIWQNNSVNVKKTKQKNNNNRYVLYSRGYQTQTSTTFALKKHHVVTRAIVEVVSVLPFLFLMKRISLGELLIFSYDARVSVSSCGSSDLFPRWFREEPGDRIVSNTPAGSTGIDTTSGSGW